MTEIAAHRVPLDKNGRLCSTDYSRKHIRYLVQNCISAWTNEIPANTPKALESQRSRGRGRVAVLEFEGFSLKNFFPQNVCRTKNHEIVICSSFEEKFARNEFGEFSTFLIHGKRMRTVQNVYGDRWGSSKDVGYYCVKDFSKETETWPATDVLSKCMMVPDDLRRNDKNERLLKHVHPHEWEQWFVSAMVL